MGKVWSWVVVKRSGKNPYIKIPKDVLREMDLSYPKSYIVVLLENDDQAKGILECMERER